MKPRRTQSLMLVRFFVNSTSRQGVTWNEKQGAEPQLPFNTEVLHSKVGSPKKGGEGLVERGAFIKGRVY